MEFVRMKNANNKLINDDIKEHREIITEYVEKKGYEYLGFIPIVFGPNGKVSEMDLIFRKPVEKVIKPLRIVTKRHNIEQKPAPVVNVPKPTPVATTPKPIKSNTSVSSHKSRGSNDLDSDRGLDLILNGGGDDLIGEGK